MTTKYRRPCKCGHGKPRTPVGVTATRKQILAYITTIAGRWA